MDIAEQLHTIQQNIKKACERSNRNSNDVTVVAVTKYVSVERTRQAIEAGVEHIGENRLEGALEKWEAFDGQAAFHFIGTLQSKKAKHIIDKYDYLHSLDRLSLAKEIEKRCPEGKKIRCFVQVNASGEASKSGLIPEETMDFIEKLRDFPSIEVVGLMTMAPLEEDPEQTRPVFKRLKQLRDDIQKQDFDHAPCHELSMGMSNDYQVAVEEGATFIRLGSTLVGRDKANG
ncbi:hypothetical protein SAMN05192534_101132 [Alteribacillus persepolensis]|uniref:Pyridoxal phosphate homeostasis protein n=1 Tax=Alteribacillus persepolensis TaxID=568899 RepID=A0A1G7YGW3_9BACI|nr:YggS family pyridoxal phosphate-dependent enzyme [Alteribacillus persepolensis]SDG95539.1 hypothetical protein SAMN05192534_101132 [Alteribacillus persepolensis]